MTTSREPIEPRPDDRRSPTIAPDDVPAIAFRDRTTKAGAARAGIVAGTALLVVVGVAATMGASAPPASTGSATADAGSPAGTTTTLTQDHPGRGFGGRLGGPFGQITITAIDGASISLETVDGWTRTIEVTDETEIREGDEAIELGELEVGDVVRFAQTREDDGSFTIDRIQVVLPHVAGVVSAKTTDTITVTLRDGSSATIHVDAATTYRVRGVEDAGLDDVAIDSLAVAVGRERADGSLDATSVVAGRFGRIHLGPGGPGGTDPEGSS
jgi:hypothetical protein